MEEGPSHGVEMFGDLFSTLQRSRDLEGRELREPG